MAAALRVQPGDRIGLVGRNGAGKTTTMRILAGEGEPYAGTIARTGEIGYLPQDPERATSTCWPAIACCRLAAWTRLLADLEKQQALMAEVADDAARDKAVRRYGASRGAVRGARRVRRRERGRAASARVSAYPSVC